MICLQELIVFAGWCSFHLACHRDCDDIDAVVRVHASNCGHLPAPPSPLVQHQAKARAEPGSV